MSVVMTRSHHPGLGTAAIAALAGVMLLAGLALAAALGGLEARDFFAAWLMGAWFWLGLSLGCLSVYMIHQCTGGQWGETLKPFLQGALALLPLLAVLFIPLAFAIDVLFPWSPNGEITSEVIRSKTLYLNAPFQIVRLVGYFLILLLLSAALGAWQQPLPGCPRRRVSGAGLILWALVSTFLTIDWVMALDPHFYSTLFGFVAAANQWLGALALGTLAVCLTGGPLATAHRLNDLGNLLLAAVMFWTYVNFMQYLIIWSGDLPHEIIWYVHRGQHGWQWVGLMLVLTQFILPFTALLSPTVKRHRVTLGAVAGLLVVGRLVESYWLIMPNFHPERAWPTLTGMVAVAGMGGLWLAGLLWLTGRWPPGQQEAL